MHIREIEENVKNLVGKFTNERFIFDFLLSFGCPNKKLLRKSISSANSWDKKYLLTRYSKEEDDFNEIQEKFESELWAVNASVHFNKWADMDKNEFKNILAYSYDDGKKKNMDWCQSSRKIASENERLAK